jgi:hypothetical protein
MPEPWRTVLEVLLTAFFGLNVVLLTTLIRRLGKLESNLQTHEDAQSATIKDMNDEMTAIRGNYIGRFAEVNDNIFRLERSMLKSLGDIQVSIARIEEHQKKE